MDNARVPRRIDITATRHGIEVHTHRDERGEDRPNLVLSTFSPDRRASMRGVPLFIEMDAQTEEVPTFWHNLPGHTLLYLLRRWPIAATWLHNRTNPTKPRRKR